MLNSKERKSNLDIGFLGSTILSPSCDLCFNYNPDRRSSSNERNLWKCKLLPPLDFHCWNLLYNVKLWLWYGSVPFGMCLQLISAQCGTQSCVKLHLSGWTPHPGCNNCNKYVRWLVFEIPKTYYISISYPSSCSCNWNFFCLHPCLTIFWPHFRANIVRLGKCCHLPILHESRSFGSRNPDQSHGHGSPIQRHLCDDLEGFPNFHHHAHDDWRVQHLPQNCVSLVETRWKITSQQNHHG